MSFVFKPFIGRQDTWNQLVETSNEGTIFHRLDFLDYHGDRYKGNEHNLGIYKGTALFGVMPLGIFEEAGIKAARSPYGASYGGPVFSKLIGYSECKEIVGGLFQYLSDLEIHSCKIVLPIPCIYHTYSETFRLVLMEYGFKLANRDISSVVRLSKDQSIDKIITSRARNTTRKAQKSGIEIIRKGNMDEFYELLEKNYKKFGTRPTHSLDELNRLSNKFPMRIYTNLAYYQNQAIAGVCNFVVNSRVNSSFYLAQDPDHQHLQALSLLVYQALGDSIQDGFEWFDFGLSSTRMQGQDNIFLFKESFGAVGLFRDTYMWDA